MMKIKQSILKLKKLNLMNTDLAEMHNLISQEFGKNATIDS